MSKSPVTNELSRQDQLDRAESMIKLGAGQMQRTNFGAAAGNFEAALEILKRLAGSGRGSYVDRLLAEVLGLFGKQEMVLGYLQMAIVHLSEQLVVVMRLHGRGSVEAVRVRLNICQAELLSGHFGTALELASDSLRLAKRLDGADREVLYALYWLALVYDALGNATAAQKVLGDLQVELLQKPCSLETMETFLLQRQVQALYLNNM